MITVGMNYDVLPEKEETFEKACNGVIKALEKAPKHQLSRLYKDVNKGSSYMIVSEWEDVTAFNQFIASEQFKNVTTWGREQILSARPKHTVYTNE